MSRIELIIGPMFSGKTSLLIAKMERFTRAHKKCVIIKHADDTRYSEQFICTHNHHVCDDIPTLCADAINADIIGKTAEYNVIGIDELHLFDHGITTNQNITTSVGIIEQFASRGQIVIITGLDSNYNRDPFAIVSLACTRASNIIKCLAVCACGADAIFTRRIRADSEYVASEVGGCDKYEPCCAACYHGLR